ncbi:8979_t:CDS:2 [Entrophospora sp. SA101]|nr:15153_t:CDS:2 [Entrophospora candida]CAH1760511.1 3029_t:CDS:2 [Entrophospora sp. SA101]CAG8439466.1 9656_t:CDS:2 [Entrophospora candida]CAJ0650604.1 8979_t:CDS:2 [Entrophospora sp. SA101]CAJ0847715.1 9731_t:CDS:2 [Entrophospora sp. SA101]
MATSSFAEILKKQEDSYETENLEADLIVSDASLSSSTFSNISNTSNTSYLNTSSYDIVSSSEGEDKFNENYDATSRKNKLSKSAIILSATIDIALAGLLIGWIYKKPTATKIQIGIGSIGLLSLYGAQW